MTLSGYEEYVRRRQLGRKDEKFSVGHIVFEMVMNWKLASNVEPRILITHIV